MVQDKDTFMVAGPILLGSIDDHVSVQPCFYRFDFKKNNGKYLVFHYANFNVAEIPNVQFTFSVGQSSWQDGFDYHRAASTSQRGWKTITRIAIDLEKEEALRKAKDYASQRNLPVYLKNCPSDFTVSVVQKPAGWEPHFR